MRGVSQCALMDKLARRLDDLELLAGANVLHLDGLVLAHRLAQSVVHIVGNFLDCFVGLGEVAIVF